jgi:hypothetical protein
MGKLGRPAKRKVSDVLGSDNRVSSVAVEEKPEPIVSASPADPSAPVPVSSPESNYPTRRDSANRISIPIDQTTGKIAWSDMQDRTIARAADALKKSMPDPEFVKYCGIAPLEATKKPEIVTPLAMGSLMDVIARVEAGVYAKKTGLEYDEVYQVVQWDKDDHRILDYQASALANKYIPASWLQYADLGMFATTMFALMKQKAALVEELAKKRFNNIVKEPLPQSTSNSTTSQPSTASPANSTPAPSQHLTQADIPPGDAARSLEDFSADTKTGSDNHRSLG